ncbi:hypothetical protein LWI28_010381 [Acer negundo]|uniref:Uncharacterized protein n=1 Tax=Acer negundo TaxID=4023 RepID=A0AAD5ID76_ACENE|nr:hypothetical protein LWI28_010381 [Acer negundo]
MDGALLDSATEFRHLVGSLQYLTLTLPNIAFVVSNVAQFLSAPRQPHLVAVKRILRYLKGPLDQELESLNPLLDDYNCIYRVPKRLRELNEKAFTPQVVSIGPMHHGTDKLMPMEAHKRKYLQEFLQRTNANMNDYVRIIKTNEDKLCNSYAEDFDLSSDEFVKMILVDAAFIIEILLKSKFRNLQSRNDRIFAKPWMIVDIMFDMCLLENQLPFFILEELFAEANISMSSRDNTKPPIKKLIHDFTKDMWDFSKIDDNLDNKCFDKVEHLVDFLSICLVPSESDRPKKTSLGTLTTPSVTVLHQAGVKFKRSSKNSLFEIKFNYRSGILEIPCLKVVKETELLFRNLLAFEQCHGSTNCINDFVVLINLLVKTPKDVDLLVYFGIIENWMPADSVGVSTLFQSLVKETSIIPENFYFAGLVEDMNRYCATPRHRLKITLSGKYFKNPWAFVTVVAANIIFLLALIQAVCSVIQVVFMKYGIK